MPRFLTGTSVAGYGMRERLQAATFAMFGMVTAIGLVLVGIAYNQGWPDFADSPIPGIRTERIDSATVAAGAVHRHAGSGNGAASDRFPSPSDAQGVVPDRSADAHGSPQQPPTPGPGSQDPASSGHGGIDAPVSHSPGPAGHSPAPAPPAPVAAQPAPAPAPVEVPPPAAKPAEAASVPGNGKAKGHEKAEKPAKAEKPNNKPAPVTPPPPPPSVPAPGTTSPQPPAPAAGPGNGSGKGNANGHQK